MKPLILYIVTMLLALSTSAQTKDSIDCTVFTVGYDYTVNTTDKEGNAVTDSLRTILMVGANVTKTMGYYTHKYKISNENCVRKRQLRKQKEPSAHRA